MKNYLRSSVALALVFFSLPTLAMEDKTDQPKVTPRALPPVTKALTQIIKSLELDSSVTKVFPDEIASSIAADLMRVAAYPDADYSNAYYHYDLTPESRKLVEPKSTLLNLRQVCKSWKTLIDPLMKEIPTLWNMDPKIEGPYPSLVSVMDFNFNYLTPEDVQAQCLLLSGPTFKNLVSFCFNQDRRGPRDTKRMLTRTDLMSLGYLLMSRADDVKYLKLMCLEIKEDDVKILSNVLPKLKNLEYIRMNWGKKSVQPLQKDLISILSSLPNLKNICLEGSTGERECTAMIAVLPQLPKLEKFYINGSLTSTIEPEGFFNGRHSLRNSFMCPPTFVTEETKNQLNQVIQEHPNKKLAWRVHS